MMRMWQWVRQPEVALFALVLGSYAYFYQAGGWNQNSRFDLTRAIVEQYTLMIDRYAYNTGDLSCRGPLGRCQQPRAEAGEHYYSDKAPGVSWLGVPMYAIAYIGFIPEQPSQHDLAVSAWWVTIASVSVPSAFGVVMLYAMLEAFTPSEPVRIALALSYGLATLAFPYSTLLYGHQLVAALLCIGFALLVRAKYLSAKSTRVGFLAGVGALLGYAVVVEYPSAMAVVLLTGYAATFIRPWRWLGWLAVGCVVPIIALGVYHWLAFGSPFSLSYEFSTQQPRHIGFMGLGRPSAPVLWELLVGSYRGLFYSAPWLALAVPGAIVMLMRRGRRPEAFVCVVLVSLFLLLNSAMVDWQGGWAMGPRYLIPALPFLTVLVIGLLPHVHPRGSAGWGVSLVGVSLSLVLAAASGALMLAGTAVKPETPMNIQRPFPEYLLPSLFSGALSTNTQSVEDLWPHAGGERQAWNVGHLVGLSGLASLAPLALYVAVVGGWLVRTAHQRPMAGTNHR